MKNKILITDWTGRVLFEGDYRDNEVDKVLQANYCKCRKPISKLMKTLNVDYCSDCDHTGYIGEFSIQWKDESDTSNVYEYVNY